jgi:hypothetical protein
MAEPRSRLAARFRKAVQSEEESKRERADASRRAQDEARVARDQLLVELAGIARDIGVLQVQRSRDGLTLRYGERYLHLAPHGDGDIHVEFEGQGDEQHSLIRQPELGHRWVWIRRRRFNREDRLPLFDQGLEELLVRGLGLPRPGDDDEGTSTPGGRSL